MKRTSITVMILTALLCIPSGGWAGKFRNGNWKRQDQQEKSITTHDGRGNSLSKQPGNKGKISGKLIFEADDGTAEPMAGCKVCFFNELEGPAPKQGSLWWRIPDYEYEGLVDNEGNFDAEVPEGEYVIASVDRLIADEDFGPPMKGEKVFISEKISIESAAKTELGTRKSHRHTREITSAVLDVIDEHTTRIEGLLLDPDGKPFKGGFVVAYPYGFLSKRTGNDGKFTLFLPQGGRYRLIARNVYGFT